MPEANRSYDSLLEFLDYLRNKGLMNQTTAGARKVAASAVLSLLEDGEKSDVTLIDLDQAMMRFQNLQGKSYTPGSMKTYKARVRAAIDDFRRYLENPLAFKSAIQPRERKTTPTKTSPQTPDRAIKEQLVPELSPKTAGPLSSSIIPIPIRSDLTIFIQGLPFDLSETEAKKISSVVQALATPL